MRRLPVIALWLVVAYLGITLAVTLSRCHYRFAGYELGEFWLLTALVGLGFLALLGVTVWISRALAGPEPPGTSLTD